jgi:hypothetical protein
MSTGDRELEALRRHGFGVAYRMLGSVSEAEDVTQEALLRLTRREGEDPAPDPTSRAELAGLQLRASFDRRKFGFEWQMQLPGGGDAVGWDVEVDIDLLLTRDDAEPAG